MPHTGNSLTRCCHPADRARGGYPHPHCTPVTAAEDPQEVHSYCVCADLLGWMQSQGREFHESSNILSVDVTMIHVAWLLASLADGP